jgi:hypothetical protein
VVNTKLNKKWLLRSVAKVRLMPENTDFRHTAHYMGGA